MRRISYIVLLFLIFSGCDVFKKQQHRDMVFRSRAERAHYISAYNKSLRLWKVPFTEEDVKTSFGSAHVIRSGPADAPPLVLLHGMNASSTMWFPNIEAFSAKYRVYAIDFLLEPGKSVASVNSLSKEDMVQWYNEIFDHYKLKEINIVGASAGGWNAVLLAIQKNSRIKKMVLLSPAQTFETVDEKGKASAAVMLKLFPSRSKYEKTLRNFSTDPKKIPMAYKRQSYLAYKHAKVKTGFLKMQPFSEEEFHRIEVPVLLLTGDSDFVSSEDSHKKAKKMLRNYKGEVIARSGHFLTVDQTEIVNKKVLDFLGR